MRVQIITLSKETTDGQWVPEARIRIHDGGGVTDQQVLDPGNRLFGTREEADKHALALAHHHAARQGLTED